MFESFDGVFCYFILRLEKFVRIIVIVVIFGGSQFILVTIFVVTAISGVRVAVNVYIGHIQSNKTSTTTIFIFLIKLHLRLHFYVI